MGSWLRLTDLVLDIRLGFRALLDKCSEHVQGRDFVDVAFPLPCGTIPEAKERIR